LPRDTVVGRPGADVTLSCWDEGPANVTVSWRMERRGTAAGGGPRRLGGGHTLVLRRLRPEDAGRYVCTGGGRRLRSLRLLVEDPPETPRVSCHRRSHEKDVVCEWGLRGTPAPGTRATLWV
ncbi:IL6RA protein, partial [Syrrhaptes paradoxus]|nr:IL6RA protein [Syrrhaptes paradoxus]